MVLERRGLRHEARATADGEDLLHVQLLAIVDEVQDAIGVEVTGAVTCRSEIRGGVEEATIGLLHDHRLRIALAVAQFLEEHHPRAVAFLQQAALTQFLDHHGKIRVIGALALQVGAGQRDTERAVDRLGVRRRHLDEALPQRQAVGVARLQFHDVVAGAVGKGGIAVETSLGLAVEALYVRECGLAHALAGGATLLEQGDQHAELRAPVAHVVLADHAMAAELQRAHHGIADHGAAQVPDVHLLGEVGCGVVNHHRVRVFGLSDTEAGVRCHSL